MTGDCFEPEEFARLSDVAERATIRKLSTSALGNLLDDVVSITMTEYWTLVQRGTQIEDPEAMVATIAQRRAIDHARAWNRRRNRRIGFDPDDGFELGIDEDLLPEVEAPLPSTLDIVKLIERAGADEIDRRIIVRSVIEGATPEDLADELGIAEKTVRNRLTAIKNRLRSDLAGG